jgi:tRNA-specific 2-thiouridylase
MIQSYKEGMTPNSDVLCNRVIKFNALTDKIRKVYGHDTYMATGHYARLQHVNGQPRLFRGRDIRKDQSYFLSQCSQDQFRNVLFPLGDWDKQRVKTLAQTLGLVSATRRESMGICFVGKRTKFASFLEEYMDKSPGDMVDVDGKVVGRHDGLHSFTVGQSVRLAIDGRRWYLARKNMEMNEMVVVPSGQHPLLYTTRVMVPTFHWIGGHPPSQAMLHAQVRYQQPPRISCFVCVMCA